MEGVQFFISCITRIEKTSRALSDEDDDDNGGSHLKTYPGVAYFVAYRETPTCSKEAIFRALHDADMDPTISEIRTRNSGAIPAEEVAAKKFAQVVKDHDSRVTIDLLHMSNRFCREPCRQHNTNEPNDRRDQPRRYPETPCRLVVVEQRCCGGALSEAHASLRSDGLQSQLEIVTRGINPEQVITAPSDITAIIRDFAIMMARFNHALHRGFVHGKPVEASLTFLKMMDVGTYINKLLGNDALRERIVKHKHRIIQLLSHHGCEIIRQIEFHTDYVEVSGGKFFQLSARWFTECPPNMELGKISPRMFMPYDSTTPPQPLYFKNAVKNSFPELPERTAFLNKFYQCFVGCRMPHKFRKLVVSRPKDRFGENVVGMCVSQDHSVRPHRLNYKRGQVFRLNDKLRNGTRYYQRLVWCNDAVRSCENSPTGRVVGDRAKASTAEMCLEQQSVLHHHQPCSRFWRRVGERRAQDYRI